MYRPNYIFLSCNFFVDKAYCYCLIFRSQLQNDILKKKVIFIHLLIIGYIAENVYLLNYVM